jgi:hypothetical protein
MPAPLEAGLFEPDDGSSTVVVRRTDIEQWAGEEQATVVNRDIAARLAALRREKETLQPAASDFATDDATRVRKAPLLGLTDGDVSASDSGDSTWLAGIMQAVLMLVVGILLGAVMMVAYGRAGGMMVNPPMLDVRSAPNVQMQVTVDGQSIQGPKRLSPGRHSLQVDVKGAQSWEVDISLEAGEYRLMMIEAHQPTPDLAPKDGQAQ